MTDCGKQWSHQQPILFPSPIQKSLDSVSPECRPLRQPDSCHPRSKWRVTSARIAEVSYSPALCRSVSFDRLASLFIGLGLWAHHCMPDIFVFNLKVFKQDNYYFTENFGCYNCAHMHLLNSKEMCLQLGRFSCASIYKHEQGSVFVGVCHCLSRVFLYESGLPRSLSIIQSGGALLAIICAVRGPAMPPPKHISLCQLTCCLWMELRSMKLHATVIII